MMKPIKAYKLFTLHKDGTISSLFINKKRRLPINKWLTANCYPTKNFLIRQGWHALSQPYAPHLSIKNRIWKEVELLCVETIKRPESQGGLWYLAKYLRIK